MRPISEILADALSLFEGGERWTRSTLFRDGNGDELMADTTAEIRDSAQRAEQFCSYGAILASMVRHGEDEMRGIYVPDDGPGGELSTLDDKLKTLMEVSSISNTNDIARDFQIIKAMFCTGIKNALKEEESDAPDQ